MDQLKPFSTGVNAGIYLGIAGVALSFIGVMLSIYSLSAGEKSIWLGISGWTAALMVGIFLCIPLWKLMTQLTVAHTLITDLAIKVRDLEITNTKIVEIDAFIISKTVRQQATKRSRKVPEPEDFTELTENDGSSSEDL